MNIPHFSHLLSARPVSFTLKATFAAIWIAIVFQNAVSRLTAAPLSSSLVTLLSEPTNTQAHISLARRFWLSGREGEALRELSLAHQSSALPSVLGAQSEDVLASWENEPKAAQQEIAFWESVIAKHPDYPDGYLGAAVASIRGQQPEMALPFTTALLSRDPNNVTGQQLLKLLGTSD